jgi:hypothetical protein
MLLLALLWLKLLLLLQLLLPKLGLLGAGWGALL